MQGTLYGEGGPSDQELGRRCVIPVGELSSKVGFVHLGGNVVGAGWGMTGKVVQLWLVPYGKL